MFLMPREAKVNIGRTPSQYPAAAGDDGGGKPHRVHCQPRPLNAQLREPTPARRRSCGRKRIMNNQDVTLHL
jgi:hypothetical protein